MTEVVEVLARDLLAGPKLPQLCRHRQMMMMATMTLVGMVVVEGLARGWLARHTMRAALAMDAALAARKARRHGNELGSSSRLRAPIAGHGS